MTRNIHSLTLLIAGLGSMAIGVAASTGATSGNTTQIGPASILAGLLCLQGMQLQLRGASKTTPVSRLHTPLLILGATGTGLVSMDLLAGQTSVLLSASLLLCTLGVFSGLAMSARSANTPRLASRTTGRASGSRQQGTVKWFNSSKGFGFISRDGQSDVFVHFRALRDPQLRNLNEGERVEFNAIPNDKGVQAEDVVLLDPRDH